MSIVQSPQFGGNGGQSFDDVQLAYPEKLEKILQLKIRHGEYIDAIQAKYRLESGGLWDGPRHGGDGGTETIVNFNDDERVVGFILRSGEYVDNIEIIAELPNGDFKTYGPFGGDGGAQHSVFGAIVALFGRSQKLLDAVGVWGHPPLSVSQATPSAAELKLEAKAVAKAKTAA